MTKNKNSNFDQEYLNSLNLALCNNFESVCKYLDIKTVDFKKYHSGTCPIHDGDNQTALTIWPNDEPFGYWQCNTYHCEKHFPKNMIGFVWAVLSANAGWTQKNGLKAPFMKVLEICKGLVGHVKLEKINHRNKILGDVKEIKEVKVGVSRESIRQKLVIPAPYFLKQGFREETLNHFDVGDPINPNPEMYNRVVVPIYDENYLFVGCQGRSKDDSYKPRWRNSKNLPVDSILYNLHAAKSHIKESKTIILVEGPKAVWRLWESGIRNVVATLGVFKSGQKILLETSGANTIICMMDNDLPGQEHFESIKSKCKRMFHIKSINYGVKLDGQDPANLSIEEIKDVFSVFGQKGSR